MTINKFIFIFILTFSACKNNGTKRVTLEETDDLNYNVFLPDSITVNDTFEVDIVILQDRKKIWGAFFQPNFSDTTSLDTNFTFIEGLTHLRIYGDTIKSMLITGPSKGKFTCQNATAIIRDNGSFYFQDLKFDYIVK